VIVRRPVERQEGLPRPQVEQALNFREFLLGFELRLQRRIDIARELLRRQFWREVREVRKICRPILGRRRLHGHDGGSRRRRDEDVS
jgi:hypothetical protein